jgi:hypothetical protein
MNIKAIMATLQNVILTLLVQATMLLVVWNVVIPSFNLDIVSTINYGQALLLIILVKILRYDPLALGSHSNIGLIARVKELEYIRQQELDKMIYEHQQKLEQLNKATGSTSIKSE